MQIKRLGLNAIFLILTASTAFAQIARDLSELNVDFSGDPVSGNSPLEVHFHDLTTGETPVAWSWTFYASDGTVAGTSAEQNPSITFATLNPEGWAVTVTLEVKTNSQTASVTKERYISVNYAPDNEAPRLKITNPSKGSSVSLGSTVKGKASDNVDVKEVVFKINQGAWRIAKGTKKWSFTLPRRLKGQVVVIAAMAVDLSDNLSKVTKRKYRLR